MVTYKTTILIIDNDKEFTYLIKRLLEETCGYEVTVVPDGYNGLIKAKRMMPGLVLLDMHMPAMNGLDILEKLKSDEKTSGIPVIIVTGFCNDEIRNKALALKAVDYVVKPVSIEVLREKIITAVSAWAIRIFASDGDDNCYIPVEERTGYGAGKIVHMDNNDRKVRVAVIDDEEDLVHTIRELLEQRGFLVSFAYDGISGLEVIKKEKPDVIILDIMMPKKDGRDLLVDLKNGADTKEIPVIMLTAKDEQSVRGYMLELGAYEYITKPYDSYALLRQIRNVLEKTGRAQIQPQ